MKKFIVLMMLAFVAFCANSFASPQAEDVTKVKEGKLPPGQVINIDNMTNDVYVVEQNQLQCFENAESAEINLNAQTSFLTNYNFVDRGVITPFKTYIVCSVNYNYSIFLLKTAAHSIDFKHVPEIYKSINRNCVVRSCSKLCSIYSNWC
jgi:hypothetical protein